MKIGLKKLEVVELSGVKDFSFFSPGSTIPIAQFITGKREDIHFTPGTGTYEENWMEDTGGMLCEISISVINRQQKDDVDNKMIKAQFYNKVAIATLMDGRVKIVGSTAFPAKMTISNSISSFDTSDKTCNISNRSPHGSFSAK